MATRLGLRDALIDWSVIYSVGYAIVAGFTWNDADPNSLLVLWGFNVMIAALILSILAFKVPHWVSLVIEFQLKNRHRTVVLIKVVIAFSLAYTPNRV